jgi:hypothetical protein
MVEQLQTGNPSRIDDGRTNGWLPDAAWLDRLHKALKVDFGDDEALKHEMVDFLFAAGFYARETTTRASGMRRFNDCLNPARTQKFGIHEIFALAVRFRRLALVSLMMEALGEDVRNVVGLLTDILALHTHNATRMAQLLATTRHNPPDDPRMHPAVREGAGAVHLSLGEGQG